MTNKQLMGRLAVGVFALFLIPVGFIAAGFVGAILAIMLCMMIVFMRDKVWSDPNAKWWH